MASVSEETAVSILRGEERGGWYAWCHHAKAGSATFLNYFENLKS